MFCNTKSGTRRILLILLFLLFHLILSDLFKHLLSVWISTKRRFLWVEKEMTCKWYLFHFIDIFIDIVDVKGFTDSHRSQKKVIKLSLILSQKILNFLEENFIVVIKYLHLISLVIFQAQLIGVKSKLYVAVVWLEKIL